MEAVRDIFPRQVIVSFRSLESAASVTAAAQQQDDPQTAVVLVKAAATAVVIVAAAAEQHQQKDQGRAGIAAEQIGDTSGILTSASTV